MPRTVIGLVLNYRDATRTIGCVRALLLAGASPVLVWDNSVDDGESARRLAAAFSNDSRVLLRSRSLNLGFAAGVNAGLAECAVMDPLAWVLLINNDAIFPQGHLPKLVAALEVDKRAVVAFPTVLQAGTLHTWLHYQPWLGLIFSRPVLGSFPFASGCCQLIATDRLRPPLYDESFFMYGEDVELSWRLSGSRQKIIHVEGVPVAHEGSASSGPNTAFYETQIVASHFLLAFRLSAGPVEAASLFVARMLTLSVRALLRSLRHWHWQPALSYVAGIREALRVQKNRKNFMRSPR